MDREVKGIRAFIGSRQIPKEDKIFGISTRANEAIKSMGMDKVTNGTIGALLEDEGRLMVLSSVHQAFLDLKPEEYAAYAPIGGLPAYKEAVKKAALGSYMPKSYVEAVASPGGTGALRNAISNYTMEGDAVLTMDWHWTPYGTIAGELGRTVSTFKMFDEKREFNLKAFEKAVEELLKNQKYLLIILNTPAHNPTGYSISDEEWKEVLKILGRQDSSKKITLLIDAAYIDFAGDEEKYRSFLPIVEDAPGNTFVLIAYSMSKTFTIYGMRTGAILCMAKTKEEAEEFKRVCEYSSRASWSNSPKAGQSLIANIYSDEKLLEKVCKERAEIRNMLLARGKAFTEASLDADLDMLPYDGGFFASIPTNNPDEACSQLEKEGIFLVPLAMGIRVSLASISEEKCKAIPVRIKNVLDRLK